VTAPFVYSFEWDPAKVRENAAKHGIAFELAASVLQDPLALTVYDEDHSETEERWVTLGCAEDGKLLVVIHTFKDSGATGATVRIISAREATRQERNNYEQGLR
jgi:uncharacterized protein